MTALFLIKDNLLTESSCISITKKKLCSGSSESGNSPLRREYSWKNTIIHEVSKARSEKTPEVRSIYCRCQRNRCRLPHAIRYDVFCRCGYWPVRSSFSFPFCIAFSFSAYKADRRAYGRWKWPRC